MTRLTWSGDRVYETGLDRGVFYPPNGSGESWNGLTAVKESPSDVDEHSRYFDGQKYHRFRSTGDFEGTIEAFTYPQAFYENGLLRKRSVGFDLSYRTNTPTSYKIHLVYGIHILPSAKDHQYQETDPFSWNFVTTPEKVPGGKSAAHLVIDAAIAYPEAIAHFEDVLYGTEGDAPRMPVPTEVASIFEQHAILKVTDNGDGTITVTGPDAAIVTVDSTTVRFTWPSVVYIDDTTFRISSL